MSSRSQLTSDEIRELIGKIILDHMKANPLDERIQKLVETRKRPLPKHKPYEDAVLCLTDIHGGKKTETYNIQVMKERASRLGDAVSQIHRFVKTGYRVDVLHILMGGDMVDGEDIYPTHSHGIDVPVLQQLLETCDALTDLIIRCGTLYKKVIIHCVKGNHGRKSKESHPMSNYDLILYHMIEQRFKKVSKIQFNISHDFYNVAEIQGKKFFLIHGNQINMYLNIPWYGLNRATASWTGSFREHFDYLVAGHFHITGMVPWNRKTIILNGTFVSSDDFGREVIKQSPSNTQWFLQVHKDRGITARYELDLLSEAERKNEQKKNW